VSTDPWKRRVDAGDWTAITAEVNEYGGVLLPQLLTAEETEIRPGASRTARLTEPKPRRGPRR